MKLDQEWKRKKPGVRVSGKRKQNWERSVDSEELTLGTIEEEADSVGASPPNSPMSCDLQTSKQGNIQQWLKSLATIDRSTNGWSRSIQTNPKMWCVKNLQPDFPSISTIAQTISEVIFGYCGVPFVAEPDEVSPCSEN